MKTITVSDISYAPAKITLAGGFCLTVTTEHDSDRTPWEECGHGPVSDWTTRDKRAGERVLKTDGPHTRFYDYAEAVKIAKRDGWDAEPYKTGTKAQQAARAVEADFKRLQDWCCDKWEYIGVIVTLFDSHGTELASDSLWGVESNGDYWRETAAEMANGLLAAHEAEQAEAANWAARDSVTVA